MRLVSAASMLLVLILATLSPISQSAASPQTCENSFQSNSLSDRVKNQIGEFSAAGLPQYGQVGQLDTGLLEGTPITFKSRASSLSLVTAKPVQIYSLEEVQKRIDRGDLTEALRPMYEKLLESGSSRNLIAPVSETVLDPLYATMPHYKPVLDRIKKSILFAIRTGTPFHFEPMVLVGDPGLGKTHFAQELAEVMGVGYEFVSMDGVTAGWILTGGSSRWKDQSVGLVAKTLIGSQSANPVIVVDEIDKASTSAQYNPLSPFYRLWEDRSAKKFVDEFIELPVDASHINWIATANDASLIPNPIRSRASVIQVRMPTEKELRAIAQNIMSLQLAKYPDLLFSARLSEDVFAKIKGHTPREARKLLVDAIMNSVAEGRQEIKPQDVDLTILDGGEIKPKPMGFL